LPPRLLLGTHILLRWFFESKKLSKDQLRATESAMGRGERLAFSAMSLLEIALLAGRDSQALNGPLDQSFRDPDSDAAFCLLPLTSGVALDAASLAALRDPSDRTIAAARRIHRLRLVTSDQHIVESGLVPVVD